MIDRDAFTVPVTNDIIAGDEIIYEAGSFCTLVVLVVSEKYSDRTHRHNFKLKVLAVEGDLPTHRRSEVFHVPGKELYPKAKYRKAWDNEEARETLRAEKHQRGHRNKDGYERKNR